MDIRIWIIFVILWGSLVYKQAPQWNTSIERKMLKRINKVLKSIQSSSQRNMQSFNFIENYLKNLFKTRKEAPKQLFVKKLENLLELVANDLFNADVQLSEDYVGLRREVRKNTHEMWNYFSTELNKIRIGSGIVNDASEEIRNLLELGVVYKRSITFNIDQMRTVDCYELWRQKESESLSDLVQKRLTTLQNPVDCKNAKKLLCDTTIFGFGSQLHHFMYCLIVAYATKRTLVLNSRNWIYHEAGLEVIFQPVSKTCTEYNMKEAIKWPGSIDTKLLLLPDIFSLRPKPLYLPLAVPEDLVPHIMKFHCNPGVWWMSQFVKYIFKPKTKIQKILINNMEKLGWKKPIVGVHIRRTDKVGWESVLHTVEEYMTYVEDYYLTLEISNNKVERRVFLATDDPNVITEARRKYPQYTILGDINVAKTANISTRFSISSLYGTMSDMYMLSLSDYLVCTFSSNLCRLAYEIMSNYYGDSCDRFKSLDYTIYFQGQNRHDREVISSHVPRNEKEIVMKCGDLINLSNLDSSSNGFTKGKNVRTRTSGLFPSFKLKNEIIRVKLPTYPNVGNKIKYQTKKSTL